MKASAFINVAKVVPVWNALSPTAVESQPVDRFRSLKL